MVNFRYADVMLNPQHAGSWISVSCRSKLPRSSDLQQSSQGMQYSGQRVNGEVHKQNCPRNPAGNTPANLKQCINSLVFVLDSGKNTLKSY